MKLKINNLLNEIRIKLQLGLLKLIMIEDYNTKHQDDKNNDELNDICDECKKTDESVTQNLILTGFKICKSCRVSKTIFPIQILFIGKAFILLITKDIDKKAIIKKDKNIMPNALKLDFKFKICFVEIIKLAKIQN